MTLAYVVFSKGKAIAAYAELEDARWLHFMLGRGSTVKKVTDRTLLQLLRRKT